MDEPCPRCLALEREAEAIRQELAAAGRPATPVETIVDNDLERELARWLSSTRAVDAAAGYRAGWAAMARHATPRLRDWERLWWKAMGEGNQLRARVGVLLREISRLSETG